jgi:hypothetical protein
MTRSCLHCQGRLPERARTDRQTCSMRCHVAHWRARRAAESRPAVVQEPEPVRLPAAAVAVVTSPASEIGSELALWLVDVALEAERAG